MLGVLPQSVHVSATVPLPNTLDGFEVCCSMYTSVPLVGTTPTLVESGCVVLVRALLERPEAFALAVGGPVPYPTQKLRLHLALSPTCTQDFSSPIAGRVADGPISGVDFEFFSGTFATLQWAGFADTSTGIVAYRVALSSDP